MNVVPPGAVLASSYYDSNFHQHNVYYTPDGQYIDVDTELADSPAYQPGEGAGSQSLLAAGEAAWLNPPIGAALSADPNYPRGQLNNDQPSQTTTIFDSETGQPLGQLATNWNPDAGVYEPGAMCRPAAGMTAAAPPQGAIPPADPAAAARGPTARPAVPAASAPVGRPSRAMPTAASIPFSAASPSTRRPLTTARRRKTPRFPAAPRPAPGARARPRPSSKATAGAAARPAAGAAPAAR